MVTFKVGDRITLCSSIRDFCSQSGNLYSVYDVNCSIGSCVITTNPFTCLQANGQTVEFKWINSIADITDCRSSVILKSLGSSTTDSSGVASIQYDITQNDLDLYNLSTSFDLIVCINGGTSSKRRYYGISGVGDNIIISIAPTHLDCINSICTKVSGIGIDTCTPENSVCTSTITDYLDIKIKPYSWYTPQGAADYLLTKISNINGAIINFFSGFTGWNYVSTSIFVDADGYVIIRINLNNTTGLSLQPQIAQAWILQIALLLIALGIILILVGIISEWAWNKYGGLLQQGKVFTPEEVTNFILENIVPSEITQCKNNFLPSNPIGYADCVKSIVCGAQNGLSDIVIGKKYGVDCISLRTNQDFDACKAQYIIDSNLANLQICIDNAAKKNNPKVIEAAINTQLEGCIVRIPFSSNCLLYDKDLLMVGFIGVAVVGGYIILTQKDNTNRVIIQQERIPETEYKIPRIITNKKQTTKNKSNK